MNSEARNSLYFCRMFGNWILWTPLWWPLFIDYFLHSHTGSKYDTEVRNSVYNQTQFPRILRNSWVFYCIVKSHGIPGISAELKSLPHKILSSSEYPIVTSVDTLIFHHRCQPDSNSFPKKFEPASLYQRKCSVLFIVFSPFWNRFQGSLNFTNSGSSSA